MQEETAPAPTADAPSIVQSETPVCGSLPECEEYRRTADRGYSMRRAWYIGITTAFCLISALALTALHYDGAMATQYVTAVLNLAGTICICYLGAGVIDRSEILHKIGDGWHRRDNDEGQH